ncbi:MAG TPA: NifU family protein [Gemmatimonadaceae bacterium]|nr:NifU family protein [Gemmatimonadaceae bacterium]
MRVWRARRPDRAEVESRIRSALQALQPLLPVDSGRVELVAFDEESGITTLHFAGDCPDCEMSAAMLRAGVEAHLRMQIPEITAVRAQG